MWDLLNFHLDLNYILGSQRQSTVFELLDLLSAVNMQLYVCGFLAISGAQLKIKLHAHALVQQHALLNHICVHGFMLMSHTRNGDEFRGSFGHFKH